MSLGRTEAFVASLVSVGVGASMAIAGKRDSGLAIAGAGVHGVVYCWNHKDGEFSKLDFVKGVGAGALTQAALSASQFQKRLTSGLTDYVKENTAKILGRTATTICGQAIHQILRGEKPNLFLITASVGLGSVASQSMEWFADKAMPLVRETLKGAADSAMQRLVDNTLRNRRPTDNLAHSAALGGGVALIQAVPEMLLQQAPQPTPAPQPMPSEQDRQYAAAYAQYVNDLTKYNETKAYWTDLLKPYLKGSDLEEMVGKILKGEKVVIHAGLNTFVYGSKKVATSCPVAPTPPVVQAPSVVVSQAQQAQPVTIPAPFLIVIPRGPEPSQLSAGVENPVHHEELAVLSESDSEEAQAIMDNEELSDAEEEQVVVADVPADRVKLERVQGQITRLEKMIAGCGAGKSGRAKKNSLSIQLAEFKSMLKAMQ